MNNNPQRNRSQLDGANEWTFVVKSSKHMTRKKNTERHKKKKKTTKCPDQKHILLQKTIKRKEECSLSYLPFFNGKQVINNPAVPPATCTLMLPLPFLPSFLLTLFPCKEATSTLLENEVIELSTCKDLSVLIGDLIN